MGAFSRPCLIFWVVWRLNPRPRGGCRGRYSPCVVALGGQRAQANSQSKYSISAASDQGGPVPPEERDEAWGSRPVRLLNPTAVPILSRSPTPNQSAGFH